MTHPDISTIASRLSNVRRESDGCILACCCFHEDKTPSLKVYADCGYQCFGCGATGSWRALYAQLGLEAPTEARQVSAVSTIVYEYRDSSGALIGRIRRVEPGRDGRAKEFFPDTLDQNGHWTKNKLHYPLPFFKLPSLKAAPAGSLVWVVEGEKAAEAISIVGGVVTTTAGGSKAFGKADHSGFEFLRGKRVVILPDNDDPGESYAAAWLSECRKRRIDATVVRFPNPTCKGYDAYDYLAGGGTLDELVAIAESNASVSREANKLASDLEEMAKLLRDGGKVADIKASALRRIASSASFSEEGEEAPVTLAQAVAEWAEKIMDGSASYRLFTGLPSVDEAIGGFELGWLCVLGGAPGAGKSALVGQLAEHFADHYGDVYLRSGEMSRTEIAARAAVRYYQRPKSTITGGEAYAFEASVRDMPLHIVASSCSLEHLVADLRLWKAQHPNGKVAIIDYLQIIDRETREDEDEVRFAKKATRMLKRVAGELGILLFLLSSITRNARQGDAPTLACFYGGAAIEANANIALCLWGDGYLWVLKHRDGPEGKAPVAFVKNKMTFESVTPGAIDAGFIEL